MRWINIHVNSFFDKYHETKMDEDALEIIISLKNIAPRPFNYYQILFFLLKTPSF